MNEQEQQAAIAELCGIDITKQHWHFDENGDRVEHWPDYLHDLNAMHEAEKRLNPSQFHQYGCYLHELAVKNPNYKMHPCYYAIHATSAQRAEAFLRIFGKQK